MSFIDGRISKEPGEPPLVRAAQYVRMSTEHQQYSLENQSEVIREYAIRRGFEIVRTYADGSKSGLKIEGRDSLKQMLADVQSGTADFKAILVLDVSRWGRFQDTDESAYYEYSCRRAGIDVHYCAEQFENDGGPVSTIIKSVKRAMAGEYSRELSAKVFQGQCRLIELGYRQGGPAGYGLRRMLLDVSGQQKGTLERGQQKSLQTDRVVLVPGPQEEIRNVRWIYEAFTAEGRSEAEIAAILNSRGIATDLGRPWTRDTVQQVLTNEKYIGNNVFNRTSFKLKKKFVVNSPEMWVRADAAFEGIISTEIFNAAREIIRERARHVSDDEMIAKLRDLLAEKGVLSSSVIDSSERIPGSSAYRNRFGSLLNAYRLAGYCPGKGYEYLEINRALRSLHPELVEAVIGRLQSIGATVKHDAVSGRLLINDEYSAGIVLLRYRETAAGAARWRVDFDQSVLPDITVLVRMDPDNRAPADFYLLPVLDVTVSRLWLGKTNGVYLDTYQSENLDIFTELAARQKIEVAA
jgi:DNA invertase Pin-like site-specific DNA recombinase